MGGIEMSAKKWFRLLSVAALFALGMSPAVVVAGDHAEGEGTPAVEAAPPADQGDAAEEDPAADAEQEKQSSEAQQ
jgi:hypothetical protein